MPIFGQLIISLNIVTNYGYMMTLPKYVSRVLRGNHLNGTLDIGSDYSKQLQSIDLVNNLVTDFKQENMEYGVAVM